MDTPLVKILLIAAAIAITVGVTVLAWSIFNEGSANVETDGDEEAISGVDGTRADGVRARIENARACEALGNAHWIERGTDTDSDGTVLSAFSDDALADWDTMIDHPATSTNERESHCAAGADVRSESDGHVRKIILWLGDDKDATTSEGDWETLTLK